MTVRNNIRIAALKSTWIWVTCIVLTLFSCVQDSTNTSAENGVTIYPAIANRVETAIVTRTRLDIGNTTDKYDDALISDGTVLRAYAVENTGASQHNYGGSFRYSNHSWRSSVTVESGHGYSIYAFTPITMPGATNQEFNFGVTQNSNNEDVFNLNSTALSFTGIDILTTTDPMVSVAVAGRQALLNSNGQELDNQGHVIEDENIEIPEINKASFNIGTVTTDVGNNEVENHTYHKIWMAMDHLYAKATISFCIDQTYHQIRDIRLKQAWITVSNGSLSGNHVYSFTNGLTLDPNAAFSSKDLTIDLMTGPTAKENRDHEKDYATLTEEYKEYAWFCFLPISYVPELTYPMVTLHVTYDVYDRDGNEVRLNQPAQNTFPLNEFIRDDLARIVPKPADHFKIKVKIKPSYLYQLIDDDAEIKLDIIRTD